jgi:hypothetical protein
MGPPGRRPDKALAKRRILRFVSGWSVVVFGVLAVLLGIAKASFEDRAAESTSAVPGARVIGSKMRRSILSPVPGCGLQQPRRPLRCPILGWLIGSTQ